MIHWLSQAFSTYVLHALHGAGYQFWSGVGSDFGEATLIAAALTAAKHHNCHRKGCWRLGHRHPEHGWPACKRPEHWHEIPAHTVKETG